MLKRVGLFVAGVAVGVGVTLALKESEEERKRFLAFLRAEVGGFDPNVPAACPGVGSSAAGRSEACAGCPNQGVCSSGEARQVDPTIEEIRSKLSGVKHKILVLSGKGGVGKSTVATQLAFGLVAKGRSVGLLDIDICGPSIPKLTGLKGQDVHVSGEGWSPVYVHENLAVMSVGFLLPGEDDAVVWRGPKKNGLIRQFLTDVPWGNLDFLIVDTPPGTSDEHLSIVTYLNKAGIDGAVVITTPQQVAIQDVRKEINFCKKVEVPVTGVIANMTSSVFGETAAPVEEMCEEMDVPFAGSIPLDRDLLIASELGRSLDTDIRRGGASAGLMQVVNFVDAHVSRVMMGGGAVYVPENSCFETANSSPRRASADILQEDRFDVSDGEDVSASDG